MTKQEQISAAKRRISIGINTGHPDWYEGIGEDAQEEFRTALALPDDCRNGGFCPNGCVLCRPATS